MIVFDEVFDCTVAHRYTGLNGSWPRDGRVWQRDRCGDDHGQLVAEDGGSGERSHHNLENE
jgi:hypothetical protein